MMTAIYDANPQAFRGDMDFLREGATLDVPDVGTNYGQLAASLR
jgi:Tfp pilus assembly protein FimV